MPCLTVRAGLCASERKAMQTRASAGSSEFSRKWEQMRPAGFSRVLPGRSAQTSVCGHVLPMHVGQTKVGRVFCTFNPDSVEQPQATACVCERGRSPECGHGYQ